MIIITNLYFDMFPKNSLLAFIKAGKLVLKGVVKVLVLKRDFASIHMRLALTNKVIFLWSYTQWRY